VHLELSTTAQYVAGATPSRSFAMIASDPMTVVDIYAADGPEVSGAGSGALIKELTPKAPKVEITDSSTYVYYVLKQGSYPSAIWMDAPDATAPGPTAPSWAVVGPVNTSYGAAAGELVLVSAPSGSGTVTITLPSAASVQGQQVAIKDTGSASSYPITVAASSGQTLDGATSAVISTSYAHLTCVSDGSNWWRI
jgi:hypothetical protein